MAAVRMLTWALQVESLLMWRAYVWHGIALLSLDDMFGSVCRRICPPPWDTASLHLLALHNALYCLAADLLLAAQCVPHSLLLGMDASSKKKARMSEAVGLQEWAQGGPGGGPGESCRAGRGGELASRRVACLSIFCWHPLNVAMARFFAD
jgi:hypothetical protein